MSSAVLAASSGIQTNPHPSTVTPFAERSLDNGQVAASQTKKGSHLDLAGGNKAAAAAAAAHDPLKTPPPTSHAPMPSSSSSSAAAAAAAAAAANNPPAPMTPRESPSRRTTGSPVASPRRSPRLGSPAGSQIFERDVQETAAALPTSPAIPSHIATEDLIPPVLDASSEAITDDRIDPDSVEIVTHTSHQPAAAAVVAAAAQQSSSSLHSPVDPAAWADQLASFEHDRSGDGASNYGSLEAADVRRLSFISFADVVQSEHGHAAVRDSIHLPAGLTSLSSVARSPSPIRSPVSSQGGAAPTASSPPTSKSGSVRGLECSPSRKPLAALNPRSPGSPPLAAVVPLADGEFKIETMSQALRRTASTDIGAAARSMPTSPV